MVFFVLKGKTISAHSFETVDAYHNQNPPQDTTLVIGMSFEEFDDASIKDKVITLARVGRGYST